MSWLDDTDPWITERLAGTEVAEAEQRITRAIAQAMGKWLALVRRTVLDRQPLPDQATTAAADDLPPDLDAYPPRDQWAQLIEQAVVPTAAAVFDEAWRQAAASADISAEQYRQRFLARVRDRLSRNTWPEGVFEEVRYELGEGMAEGESVDQLRDRIGMVLKIDAPTREVRGRINQLRREGQPVPRELWDAERETGRPWRSAARRIARTELISAYNGGSTEAAQAVQDATGEQLYKVWYATSDSRVRDDHWAAHKQVRPMGEPFDVGGEALDFPGDPNGSASNTINCRCTVLTVRGEQAEQYRAEHDAELPHRTDIDGQPLAAATTTPPEQEDTPMPLPDTAAAPADTATTWADRVAAAVPSEPPAEWFADPQLTGPTKVRVLDTGRVVGHVAAWGTEHASLPGVTPPRDPYGGQYPRFHRHPVRTADGTRINTGPLATGGHADIAASLGEVVQHYDDPTFVVADVRAGEDAHGIWVSGALRPEVTPFQVSLLDRYSISGDWRDGELVAACSVSVPGFHLDNDDQVVALSASAASRARLAEATPRQHLAADGHTTALVAAGVVRPEHAQQREAELAAWARLRAERKVARIDRTVQAAARRTLAPGVQAAARRIIH